MSSFWIFCHVRPGFEEDGTLELEHHLKTLGATVLETKAGPGFFHIELNAAHFSKVRSSLRWNELIFVRQLLWSPGVVTLATDGDRISGLVESIQTKILPLCGGNAFSGFFLEPTDDDSVKELSGFCKSLTRPLDNALNRIKVLPKGKGAQGLPRLHMVMTSPSHVWACFADVDNSAPWSMGIPRLKFPPKAPSRSTLKLEEAFYVFLTPEEASVALKKGMTAVDLGACPGGWTYQLVQRGIHVTAVDNGAMDPNLMDSGLVQHERADAFHFRPRKQVDWLVCDVVEQPSKINTLMAEWITEGWCQKAIFNLKLPMKQRFKEVQECLREFTQTCDKSGVKIFVKCKQLYHDRKEVTVYVARM